MDVIEPGRTMLSPARVGRRLRFVEPLLILLLVVLRLSITWDQPMAAFDSAEQDDRMFIDRAESIANGQWMGPYNQWTLMKGPAYPLIIAGAYELGISVGRLQQVLWVVACVAFVGAVAPVVRHPGVRVFACAVLLFNPYGFNTSALARVLRQGIYPSLTLLVLACANAVYLRAGQGRRGARVWWTVALAFVLPVFWLTRDEGIWAVAPLGVLGVLAVLKSGRADGWRGAAGTAGLVLLPWAGVVVASLAVCLINYRTYGVFATIELRAPAFLNAYGALARVRPDPAMSHVVVVSREARMKLYEVSPAFEELRPGLEGPEGKFWSDVSGAQFGVNTGEIYGGWWLWALRDMVNRSKHGRSAPEALAFYHRIADEVNRACDEGRLPAEPFRPTLTPPWRSEYARKLYDTYREGWAKLVVYARVPPTIPTSGAPGMSRFQKYLTTRLTPPYPAERSATVLIGRAASVYPGRVRFEAYDAPGHKIVVDQIWRDNPAWFEQLRKEGATWDPRQVGTFELMVHDVGDITLVALDLNGREVASFKPTAAHVTAPGFVAEVLETCALPDAGGQEWRVNLLGHIFAAYQAATWWLLWPAGACLVLGVVRGLRGHGWDGPVVALTLLLAVNVYLLMLSYIHFTSFPALSKGYIGPLPGWLLAAMVVSFAMPFEMWIDRWNARKPSPAPAEPEAAFQKGL